MASIKAQILAAIREKVNTLNTSGSLFRVVKQTRNLLLEQATTPALCWGKGREVQEGQDNRGRHYAFPLGFKIIPEKIEDEEELVAAVTALIEGDIQLAGLVVTIDEREESPFVNAGTEESGGVLLTYMVHYRHVRGEPQTNY